MTYFSRAFLGTIALVACTPALRGDTPSPGNPEGFEQTTLYKSGTDGYLFYRIPSLLLTTKGSLLAFAEARRSPWGPGADSGEINVVLKRSTDGGKSFSPQQVVWADGTNTCGNPTSVVDATTGTIWLLACHNLGDTKEEDIADARAGRTVFVMSSDDDGVTWSKPREITGDVKKPGWTWYATGPGVGIQLQRGPHAGRLVIPANHAVKGGADGGFSHVIYSDDHGKSWQLGGDAPAGGNESQVVELSDGTVMLNMRNARTKNKDDQPRERAVALSTDGGETFGPMTRDAALIEPLCQGSIVRYTWPGDGASKSRILFANPASREERVNMTVRISYDEGKTWPVSNLIHKGWSCYSSITPLPDGKIALLYEAGDRARYDRLDLVRMTLPWLSAKKDELTSADQLAVSEKEHAAGR